MIEYLKEGKLPTDPTTARKIAAQATQFVLLEGLLYFLDPRKRLKMRAVIPTHLKNKLIEEVHGGH